MNSTAKTAACVDSSADAPRRDTAPADALHAIADQGDPPLDIHDICRLRRACGLTEDLALTACEAQAINTRLYGMTAISALLVGADDDGDFKLSRWLQGGLHSALYALTEDAQAVLHRAHERATPAQRS